MIANPDFLNGVNMTSTDNIKKALHKNKQSLYQRFNTDIKSGMISGIAITGLFNPIDQALYLSVINKIPFLSRQNFAHPWHGFSQAIVSRSISGGIYFVLQSQMNYLFKQHINSSLNLNEWQSRMGVGLCAGSLTGFTANSLYAVRFRTWSTHSTNFFSTINDMFKKGGIHPFMKGISASIARDAVFGITYEFLRHSKKPNNDSMQLVQNIAAGCAAAIVSSPLNYVRSMQYASSPEKKAPNITQTLTALVAESKSVPTGIARLKFFQQRLLIGYGTARVGVGIAAGQILFEKTQNYLRKK